MAKDPYAVLGVAPGAPDFVIQAAYRACLKRYHPDHYKESDARARTSEVIAAYELLRDPQRRASYDAQAFKESSSPPPPPPPSPPQSSDLRHTTGTPSKSSGSSYSPFLTALGIVTALAIGGALMLAGAERTGADEAASAAAADTVEMPAEETYYLPPVTNEIDTAALTPPLDVLADEPTENSYSYPATPISFANVEKAADDFAAILNRSGIAGARRYSEKCHASQSAKPSWDGLDYCAAFDYAADSLDRGFSSYNKTRRNSYFSFQAENQADYYVSYKSETFSRLPRVRAAAQAALADAMIPLSSESPATTPTPSTGSEGQSIPD